MTGVAAEGASRGGRTGSLVALFSSTLAFQFVGLVLGPLLARALGPVGRGRAALVTVYDDASTAVFHCGLPSSIGYFGKEGIYSEQALASAALRYGVRALPLSLLAGVATVRGPLAGLDHVSEALVLVLVGFSPLLATLSVVGRQFLLNRGDLAGLSKVYRLQLLCRATLVVGAFLAHSLTLPVAILALSFSSFAGSLFAWRRSGVRPVGPPAPLRPLLAYGVRALPGSLCNLANGRVDQLLVAPLLGTRQLGLYAVVVSLNFVIVNVGLSVGTASFSEVRGVANGERDAPAARRLRLAGLLALTTSVPVAVFLVSPVFPLAFGDDYAAAVGTGLVLLPGSIAFAVMLVGQQVLIAHGRPGWGSAGLVVGIVGLAVLMAPCVSAFGLLGAALASSVGYALGLAVILGALHQTGVRYMLPQPADLTDLLRQVQGRLGRGPGARPPS